MAKDTKQLAGGFETENTGGVLTGSSSGLSGFDSFDIPLEAWYLISGVFLILLMLGAWL